MSEASMNTRDKEAVAMVVAGHAHCLAEAKGGVLEGAIVQPYELAALCETHGWRGENLEIAVATFLGESNGYTGAYNINKDKDGNPDTVDCGITQINIPYSEFEGYGKKLRTDADFAIAEGRRLWITWGGGQGEPGDTRAWNHWVAFSSGIVLDPTALGIYIWRALRGIANHRGFVRGCGTRPDNPAFYYKGGKSRPPGFG